ncbi:MAG TPA: MFS transporter [Actinomycetota bacterium]|nr:MFS transporter [Actinomycetota bacterium]
MARRFSGARALALDISPLRDSPAYRALWIGQIISFVGTNMRYVAVPVQVYRLTGSTVAVGLIGLAEVIPLIIVSVFAGALADSHERRALIAKTQIGLIASSLALAAISLMDRPSLYLIYGLTAIASAFNALDRPARTAMTPDLVAPGKISAAMALRQVVYQVTQIIGPLIAGLMLAVVAVSWVYLVDAITYVAALVSLRWVPRSVPVDPNARVNLQSIRDGLSFSLKTPLVLSIFVIDLVAMIFGMPRAVFPALAEQTFGMGPAGVGLLYAAPSIGALIGAVTTGWVKNVRRQGRAVLISVMAWGLAITLAGLSLFSLALTMFFLAVAGAADVLSAVFRGTMLLEATPEELRGRVSAVQIMVVTGGPRLGDVEAGLAAGLVGAPGSVVVGGAACVAGTVLVGWVFRSLRDYAVIPIRDRVADQRLTTGP